MVDGSVESTVERLCDISYQCDMAAEVRDALLEVRDNTTDTAIKTEAQSLAETVGSYVVRRDILTEIQHVNRLLQSETMHMDVAVDLLRKTEASLVSYRDWICFCTNVCQRNA